MTNEDTEDARRAGVPVPSGRLARLARLGSTGAGVAGRVAAGGLAELGRGRRPQLRDLVLTPGNVRRVTDQLAEMRGAAMKLGQLLSMDAGEVLPPELAAIMARLRAEADAMPPAQLRRVLDREWPRGWLSTFARFDVHPVAAASIGQVHRAWLKDGRALAIKVQYPGVAASIDSDVANVGALLRISGLLPRGFDLAPYLAEARAQLHAETDYMAEGAHLARFADVLAGDDRFAVPEYVASFSTGSVLSMSFMEGAPIESVAEASQAVRDRVARDLIDLTLRELFVFGWMQTDPNFANYRWDAEAGRIVLLDFGATRRIDPATADLHRRLLIAALDGDRDRLRALAGEVGVIGPDTPAGHADRILDMAEIACAELRRTGPLDIATLDLPRRLQAEAIALAEDGLVPPPLPMEALHVQRKIAGMYLLAARLRARVPVREMVEGYLGRAEPD
ncbi:AarF/ABC1/UbiB kinase family protein [uncultured Jannaschia sp.]|uniref:ABC1 kinase family protein n=1 Tax=uncultured Jannaschia sp. TaxID=293347 RepID=UPI00260F2386|nr:AarF/ABC1/UbiB kinase family protein [uncultured Jannaschia sp.]